MRYDWREHMFDYRKWKDFEVPKDTKLVVKPFGKVFAVLYLLKDRLWKKKSIIEDDL